MFGLFQPVFVCLSCLHQLMIATQTTISGLKQSKHFYSVLVTRVGIKGTVSRIMRDSYQVHTRILHGSNPFTDSDCRTNAFTYVHVPVLLSCFNPSYVQYCPTTDTFGSGKNVHIRVHSGYTLEVDMDLRHGTTTVPNIAKYSSKYNQLWLLEDHMIIHHGTREEYIVMAVFVHTKLIKNT